MRNKSRILITLIIILTMAIPNLVLANSQLSDSDMVTALDTLTILRGDGEDYNLSGQLKRSEAVAFLVRLLGVEDRVIKDKDRYINDDYTDIDSNQWYAYYIGYVTSAGIVNGYSDNTFKPDEFVTEKEFTKMILGALNYKQQIDYKWDDIYSFGYSIGLFDNSYKNKLEDNKEYTREGAITLMYKALNTKINQLDKTITEKLIDREVFTEEQAIKAGVLVDSIKSDITSLNVINDRSIRIALTEEVNEFDKDNIIIYEETDDSEKLEIDDVVIDKDLITITTQKQKPNKKYILKIREVEDKEGFKTLDIEKEFESYVDQFIESNFFRISKVKAISKDIINVYFTHPINNRVTIPMNYTIMEDDETLVKGNVDNMGISLLPGTNNGISIFLKNDSLKEGVEYTISIDGKLSSLYGVDINDGNGEKMNFIGTSIPSPVFSIEDIEVIDENYILITFNNPVDTRSATNTSNYELEDGTNYSRRSIGAEMVGLGEERSKQVKVKFSHLKKEKEYNLKIEDVYDSYKQMYINEDYPIYSYMDTDYDVGIDYAYAENQNTLVIYFSEVIPDIKSAKFIIPKITIKTIQYDSSEPDRVIIYTREDKPLREDNEYELTITNARDEFGNRYNDLKCTFEGTSQEFDDIYIDECKFISDEKVYVEFDKNIDYSSNLESRFKLQYTKNDRKKTISPKSISRVNDRTILLRFSNIDESTEYKLKLNSIEDYSKQFTTYDLSSSVDW